MIRTAATIGFAFAPCSLGFVIVAVSEQWIRSIMVGDDPEMLMADLQNQYPHDAVQVDHNFDLRLIAKVVGLIEQTDQTPDLPLDVGAAGFQTRVWEALRRVPAGTTVNYTFLADQIGAPGADPCH